MFSLETIIKINLIPTMKKKYTLIRYWITVFVLFVLAPMALAQENAKQIDDLMRTYVENGQFNGSVLVAESGKVIFKKGYGKY
jgi:DMSO reductase anchor subunit